ncbi:hypothetical protein MNBD_NITROSPIRAE03-1639 [hydrothermal vent metagenome]|uniref:Eight transmembrane protein EpsH n=1 Tax=hydrothermal vent metagenome TaxID=652676 RepID=A0A3B1DZT8_9ZZZZ
MQISRKMISGHLCFLFFTAVTLILFYTPLRELMILSFHKEVYSHIILVPLVSGYFFYLNRETIFANTRPSFVPGGMVVIFSAIVYLIGTYQGQRLNQNDYLSLMTFSALICWGGGFILSYGHRAFHAALFPLLYLVFMIPIPSVVLEWLIHLLRTGSVEVVAFIFRLTGVPAVREGYVFHLPSVSIEVASQCSGIRSTIVLFISSIIAGHVFLRTGWKKVILSLSIFPVTILKNGFRIVTLALLGEYVDETFLTNSILHKNGGILFLLLAVLLLLPILWVLSRSETKVAEELNSENRAEK